MLKIICGLGALLALAMALAGLAPQAARGATVAAASSLSLAPSADTYVSAAAPGASYAAAAGLIISRDTSLQESYALLRFDLAALPAGARVTGATLTLAVAAAAPGSAAAVRVERVTAPWDGATVTWASRPASADTGVSHSLSEPAGAYASWDVSALARQWAMGDAPNYGLALRGPATPFAARSLGSAEFGKPPQLQITYTLPQTIDLRVALEWEPGGGDSLAGDLAPGCPAPAGAAGYRANLEQGLREAARYFYGFSEGQITLGAVSIGTDGAGWDAADVRILASSGYRPSAYVGGVVDTPQVRSTPGGRPVLYYPAPVTLGRLWDGGGARCGAWGDPEGWRTLGHELAHYALFLYDEYFSVADGAPQYCSSSGLSFLRYGADRAPLGRAGLSDTLMAYHYTADKLRVGGLAAAAPGGRRVGCADTPNDYIYLGKSDWEVVKSFYPDVSAPAAGGARTDWDSRFAAEVEAPGRFSVSWERAAAVADSSADVRLAALGGGPWHGEAFLVRESAPGVPARIIGQGWRLPGEASPPPFWGAIPGQAERAAIFVDDQAHGLRAAAPPAPAGELSVSAVNAVAAAPSQWRPSMVISPSLALGGGVAADVTGLNVALTDCAAKAAQVDLAYCPAGGGCGAPVRLSAGADGVFRHRFPAPVALYGYIYARDVGGGEEAISWYQLAGGVGPAHIDGHAPLLEGPIGLDVPAGSAGSGGENRVLISPTAACVAGGLPAGVVGIVGAPLGVQVTVAGFPQQGLPERGWGAPGRSDPPLRVRLFYDQALLDALGVGEAQLQILRFVPGNGWKALPDTAQSADLDWIAADAEALGGEGAIYALGYGRARTYLPVIRR